MACSSRRTEAGYATVAAVAFSLAIGLIAAALIGRSGAEFAAARSELARTRAEYALAGDHEAAAFTLAQSLGAGPLAWRMEDGAEVLAQGEASKLALARASALPNEVFRRLGVDDPDQLRGRLDELTGAPQAPVSALTRADAARGWRSCARWLISAYGAAQSLPARPPAEPAMGGLSAHAGELWLVRIRRPDGWSDERLVRMTGDLGHPSAPIERAFSRSPDEGTPCPAMQDDASA